MKVGRSTSKKSPWSYDLKDCRISGEAVSLEIGIDNAEIKAPCGCVANKHLSKNGSPDSVCIKLKV